MKQISTHAWRLEAAPDSRVFLLQTGGAWVLIDTGFFYQAGKVKAETHV